MVRTAACAILTRGGEVMLGRRASNTGTYAGCWDLLGGHVEAGESVDAALVRELGEEVGIRPTTFTPLGTLPEPHPEIDGPAVYHLYAVSAWAGGEPTMAGDEHSEIRWFAVEEACSLPNLELRAYVPFLREAARL